MNETPYNKLIRDKIPAIIEANGERAVTRILNTEDYKRALLEKLVEEAKELLESGGSIEERADVAEVLAAYDAACDVTEQQIDEARREKSQARGSFMGRIYLEKTFKE